MSTDGSPQVSGVVGTAGAHAAALSANPEPGRWPADGRFPETHFWVLEEPANLRGWDPDREPERFQDGFGHSILELYARLENLGLPVTIGRNLPKQADIVVAFAKHIAPQAQTLWRLPETLWRLQRLRRNPGHLVVIMSDFGADRRLAIRPGTKVVPYRACIQRPEDVWIPLLPQRGLLGRESSRRSVLETIGYFGSKRNAPVWLMGPSFKRELHTRGVRLELSLREPGDTRPWHDFRGIDAVICARRPDVLPGPLSKPATKLINAWAAGAIPIIDREPAMLELVNDHRDAIVLDDNSSSATLRAIDELLQRRQLREALYENALERSRTFGSEAVLSEWIALLTSVGNAQHPRARIDLAGAVSIIVEQFSSD